MTYEEIDKIISKSELSPIEWLAENHDKIFYVNKRVDNLDPITYGVVKGVADIACDVADIDDFPKYFQEYFDISLDKMELAVSDSVIDWAKDFAEAINGKINLGESLVYGARDMFFDFYCGSMPNKEAELLENINHHFFIIELNTDGKYMIFLD